MVSLPDAIFIIDINKEAIAVSEANKLNIPVVAICDTNTDPSNIDYPIPGNDDAVRAVSLYCDLVGASILSGLEENIVKSGADIGMIEEPIEENLENVPKENDLPQDLSPDALNGNEAKVKAEEATVSKQVTETNINLEKVSKNEGNQEKILTKKDKIDDQVKPELIKSTENDE